MADDGEIHECRVRIAGLTVLQTLYVTIVERLNWYPTVSATCVVAENLPKTAACVGSSFECVFPNELLFRGEVTATRCHLAPRGTRIDVQAAHPLVSFDREVRDAIYGNGEATRICDLMGIQSLLETLHVEGGQEFNLEVQSLVQTEETDWAFIVRIANLCGCYIRVVGTTTAVVGLVNKEPVVQLKESEVRDFNVRTRNVRGSALAHRWNRHTGGIEGIQRFKVDESNGDYLATIAHLWRDDSIGGFYPPVDPGPHTAEARAKARLREEIGNAYEARIVLEPRRSVISPGTIVKLPEEWGFGAQETLVIHSKVGIEHDRDQQEVVCVLTNAIPRSHTQVERAARIWLGRVVRAPALEKHGRVEVLFPQIRNDLPPDAAVASVQCDIIQPCAGSDESGPAGTWIPPNVNDWVLCIVLPDGTGVPIVIGALYKGNAPLRDVSPDVGVKVVLAASGMRIEMDTTSGVVRAIAKGQESAGTRIMLSGDAVKLSSGDGEKQTSVLLTRGGVQVHANTTVDGTLDVKRKSD